LPCFPQFADVSLSADQTVAATQLLLRIAQVDGARTAEEVTLIRQFYDRPGRLDRKIPFFYAETAAERAAVVGAIFRRYDVARELDDAALQDACEALDGYSNADLEAVALLAAEFAERERTPLTAAVLARAIDDFMPPQEVAMVRYMEMLAVSETSRRSLLPQRFRSLSVQEVQTRLADCRRQINL